MDAGKAEAAAGKERGTNGQSARRDGRRHVVVASACAAFIAAMVGVTYASVPLYAMFCALTGFGGATRVGAAPSAAPIDREITIRFDANVAPGLPWAFAPVERDLTIKVGATSLAHYTAANRSALETHANATYNVSPPQAGAYFVKLQCFCFDEQTLGANEKLEMPVVFYVDPAIAQDPDLKTLTDITLSYTFFPAKTADKPVARASGTGADGRPL
ncbi:UNVERIFIED_ORG: cytochrome c oxidase assembly protein subunit 11 [Xanthobacter viscosus]|jgi:cytochrome c oxidase assembly protein subunit 11|uniref:Cytochrome c oxidase assembly protein CtaG n=1 Tax=Xanthobacter autotrophicus TaxID=280 RepID=A0A6C1KK87_XANAU|nr:cytochrome c oxidase assembly protein [Xanthobacter autotrophicus]TLX44057.1 cytochrome c oxidase assembly protein [Xanthobacter autotrophicus]